MTAIRDLRQYIDHLTDTLGEDEVRVVDGAHWDLEIGCITELLAEAEGPALLFDNIPGYPAGRRVLTNFMGTAARTAVALGLPRTARSSTSSVPGRTSASGSSRSRPSRWPPGPYWRTCWRVTMST